MKRRAGSPGEAKTDERDGTKVRGRKTGKEVVMRMRTLLAIGIGVALAAGALAGEPWSDTVVRYRGIAPSETMDWSYASGIEAQIRFWGPRNRGIALTVGYDMWTAAGEFLEEEDEYGYYSVLVSGHTALMPVGASLLHRMDLGEFVSLTFEGGLRYVFVESSVNVETEYEDDYEYSYNRDTLEADDTYVAIAALHMEAEWAEDLLITGGVGYQFDLGESNERLLGEDLGTTSYQGLFANVGLVMKF
jgi:hypothetical protein